MEVVWYKSGRLKESYSHKKNSKFSMRTHIQRNANQNNVRALFDLSSIQLLDTDSPEFYYCNQCPFMLKFKW